MQRILDVAAIGLSGLCFVHCLILPVAAGLLPLLGAWAQAEYVHWVFLAIAAPVAIVAIAPAFKTRPVPWLLPALAALGVALLFFGALDIPSHTWGTALTVAGGFSVASAHLLNWRRAHAHHAHAKLVNAKLTHKSRREDFAVSSSV